MTAPLVATFVVTCQLLACLGLGALGLWLLGLLKFLPPQELGPWSFALGFGLLSLLVFPLALAGWISPPVLGGLLALPMPGLLLLLRSGRRIALPSSRGFSLLLYGALALALILYLSGALVPPADGDSMAYHFARIKSIALHGRLTFLAQAVEGAAPMMAHMTYLPAYVLGGEQGLTLWTTASGLMTGLLFYVLALRWLGATQALLLALILITTPAVVFGTTSGQVEIRNALFVLISAFAIVEARRTASWRWLVLAGLAAGFFAGSKIFGLFWLCAAGLAATWQRRWLRSGLIFSATALLVACPWYVWNAAVTGDPLFPVLHRFLRIPDNPDWTLAHLDLLTAYLKGVEQPAPPTLDWFLAYPFLATLRGLPLWESGRTGFGVFCLLAMPFALAGAWLRAARPGRSALWILAGLCLLFYTLWFFLGTAQRLRHLLPLYPLLLLVTGVAACKLKPDGRTPKPLQAGALAVLLIQLSGLALFNLAPLRALAGQESRQDYLQGAISLFAIVPWINSHLGPEDRILLNERQLLYHLDVPYFFAHPVHQAQIDLRPDAPDGFANRWRAMRRLGVSHILLTPPLDDLGYESALKRTTGDFLERGCARLLHQQTGQVFVSRTLSNLARQTQEMQVYALTPASCIYEADLQKMPNTVTKP